ncbi:MAG TPA: Ada metal-binding domain-containing protein [Bdellovibrionota bacterium]|nr:Ada metal-binding domain-containing protein [Bdellovibrionota bacterium]
MKREDAYYEAILARDHRFDGKFFVGVKTTGIYCRPICPARPKRENMEFFPSHLAAEKAGYRPCLRCRPESAPRSPVWIGKSAIVRRAIKMINSLETLELDEDRFAEQFGVSARHLRRVFIEEIGKTPKQLAFENRLNLARKLLTETSLPIAEVAFAAGFRSIRRFNDAFKGRFGRRPSEIRRLRAREGAPLRISLPYRPPFDFEGLLASYRNHRIGLLERFEEGKMHRVVALGGKVGEISISNDPEASRLLVDIDFPDTSMIHSIISRVRALFDLDSDPVIIANCMEGDPGLKALLRKCPGIRLPSGWDGFEVAVSAILGQLVSVERGRALVADLIELLGEDSGRRLDGKPIRLFPTPERLASADLASLKSTGVRKQTLKAFAAEVASSRLSLDPAQDVDRFIEQVLSIRGIGPWTASYMALKVLRHTDAFPSTDLILARALEIHAKEAVEKAAPWRGYAAALLWRSYAKSLTSRASRRSERTPEKRP